MSSFISDLRSGDAVVSSYVNRFNKHNPVLRAQEIKGQRKGSAADVQVNFSDGSTAFFVEIKWDRTSLHTGNHYVEFSNIKSGESGITLAKTQAKYWTVVVPFGLAIHVPTLSLWAWLSSDRAKSLTVKPCGNSLGKLISLIDLIALDGAAIEASIDFLDEEYVRPHLQLNQAARSVVCEVMNALAEHPRFMECPALVERLKTLARKAS